MTLRDIVELLEAEVLYEGADLNREVPCAFASDLISDILMCTKEPTLLLTGLTNNQVIRLADMIDLIGIVFVRGKKPMQDVIDMAKELGVYIHKDPVLLNELKALKEGEQVPEQLFQIIAEILAFSYLLQGKTPESYVRADGTKAINTKA